MNFTRFFATLLLGFCFTVYAAEVESAKNGEPLAVSKKEVVSAYHPVALKVGQKAPDFEALDSNGKKVKLSDFKGKKIALYFYPKSNTYGCNAQAFSFRDTAGAYERNNVQVIGISYDTPEFQNKFKTMYALPFTLLSDEGKDISKKYATYQVNNEWVPARVTFLIDENGAIVAIMRENANKPEDRIVVFTHAQDVLKRFGFQGEQLKPY